MQDEDVKMKMTKSKTMWFALALSVLGAAMEFFPLIRSLVDPKYYGAILFAIGVICAVLRFYTTQPLSEK
jgi:bacteriorhodopsin